MSVARASCEEYCINLVPGAISSSGVTKAIYDFWEYYEPVREYGPPDCILATQKLTNIVDNILLGKNSTKGLITELKTAFGLQDIQYVFHFADLLRIWPAAQFMHALILSQWHM